MNGRLYKVCEVAEALNVSPSYISAVKKAMGNESRWMDLGATRQWIVDHPNFRASLVWPKKAASPSQATDVNPPAQTVDKFGEFPPRRDLLISSPPTLVLLPAPVGK